jgi:hypothetical protein
LRWPFLPVILTSGHPRERQLPLGVDFMPKPWQPLNLLVAARVAGIVANDQCAGEISQVSEPINESFLS